MFNLDFKRLTQISGFTSRTLTILNLIRNRVLIGYFYNIKMSQTWLLKSSIIINLESVPILVTL